MLLRFIFAFMLILVLNIQACANTDRQITTQETKTKKVEIGMAKRNVLEILGQPSEIRTSKESKFLSEDEEAWHYDKPFFSLDPKIVIFFKNGFVSDSNYIYK